MDGWAVDATLVRATALVCVFAVIGLATFVAGLHRLSRRWRAAEIARVPVREAQRVALDHRGFFTILLEWSRLRNSPRTPTKLSLVDARTEDLVALRATALPINVRGLGRVRRALGSGTLEHPGEYRVVMEVPGPDHSDSWIVFRRSVRALRWRAVFWIAVAAIVCAAFGLALEGFESLASAAPEAARAARSAWLGTAVCLAVFVTFVPVALGRPEAGTELHAPAHRANGPPVAARWTLARAVLLAVSLAALVGTFIGATSTWARMEQLERKLLPP